jgi:hypothetical protein
MSEDEAHVERMRIIEMLSIIEAELKKINIRLDSFIYRTDNMLSSHSKALNTIEMQTKENKDGQRENHTLQNRSRSNRGRS